MVLRDGLALLTVWTSLGGALSLGQPIVIAHRGASGHLPEHTLEAYSFAYAQGADYIEPDLVLTRDGVFICLHDIHLEATTDVEERFPERRRKDGRWYAADLTLVEIRSLRVHERTEGRFPKGRSRFEVPTLVDMVELVQGLNRTTGGRVGIYPELKQPSWHRAQGLPMEAAFLEVVKGYGYQGPGDPIFVQCFEPDSLRRLRSLGSRLPQIQLVSIRQAANLLSPEGLRRMVGTVQGIGPHKEIIQARPDLIEKAHQMGLKVHPYSFRADAVPSSFSTYEDEVNRFLELGIDGLFTDFPGRTRQVVDTRARQNSSTGAARSMKGPASGLGH